MYEPSEMMKELIKYTSEVDAKISKLFNSDLTRALDNAREELINACAVLDNDDYLIMQKTFIYWCRKVASEMDFAHMSKDNKNG
jgi:hypothetical protein